MAATVRIHRRPESAARTSARISLRLRLSVDIGSPQPQRRGLALQAARLAAEPRLIEGGQSSVNRLANFRSGAHASADGQVRPTWMPGRMCAWMPGGLLLSHSSRVPGKYGSPCEVSTLAPSQARAEILVVDSTIASRVCRSAKSPMLSPSLSVTRRCRPEPRAAAPLRSSRHDLLVGPVVDARCLGGGVNHKLDDDPMKIRRGCRVKWLMCCGAACDQLHIQPATRHPAPY